MRIRNILALTVGIGLLSFGASAEDKSSAEKLMLTTSGPLGPLYSKNVGTTTLSEFLSGGANVGDQKEEKLFSLRTGHGWDGPPACNPHSGGAAQPWDPPSGWAVVGVRKTDDTVNNGTVDITRSAGGPSFPNAVTINNQFETLMVLARYAKNDEAAKEIRTIRDNWLKARQGTTEYNHVVASVWAGAHGNCGDRKDGWAQGTFFATIRFVGDEDTLSTVVSDIRNKYFP